MTDFIAPDFRTAIPVGQSGDQDGDLLRQVP